MLKVPEITQPFQGCLTMFPGRDFPLRALPTHCGYQRVTSRAYDLNGMERGNQEYAIWQYTLAGRGNLEHDGGAVMKVEPGQAMLLRVPERHRYFFTEDVESWEFIYVGFNGREAMRLWWDLQKKHGPLVKLAPDGDAVGKAVEIYNRAVAWRLNDPFHASSLLYAFIMDLAREAGASQGGMLTPKPDFADKIFSYCSRNLGGGISVDDLAKVAGYSKFHFTRLFTAYYGLSPAAFVADMRMKTAMRMLQNERMNVKEIATVCGFPDASYFCKVFQRAYGVSPGKFRTAE